MRTILGLLLALLWGSGALQAQERSLLIERFDATLEIQENGWLDVRERVQVRFNGSWNGIFRDIPVEYRTPQGFSYKLFVTDVDVTGVDGEPLEYWDEREGRSRRLRIRVPGAQDATRTVNIHYRVPNGLRFQDEYDELYWNVTGDEWEMPIDVASALVRLPEGVEELRTASWTGGYGSREDAAEVTETEAGFYFETREQLDYREGLTIAVAWAPGAVDAPGPLRKAWFFFLGNWLFVFPLFSLFAMWKVWAARGRDPRPGSVAPQYEPPRGLNPAEMGTLVDNRPDIRDITALLVHLAVQGELRIEEVGEDGWFKDKDYRLVALRPRSRWGDLGRLEELMMSALFEEANLEHGDTPPSTLVSELKYEFYSSLPGLHNEIFRELLDQGLYDARPDKVLQRWAMAGALLTALGFGGGIILADFFTLAPLTGALAGLATGLPVLGFSVFMPARTRQGARARDEVLGFQEFLTRVEADRYRRMITGPEMFERFLPYAMALGVAHQWAKAFEGLAHEPPSWYVGDFSSGFHPSRLTDTLGSMSHQAGAAMATQPRSSGGSGFGGGGGGGGFSGGGFGGGGGGGW